MHLHTQINLIKRIIDRDIRVVEVFEKSCRFFTWSNAVCSGTLYLDWLHDKAIQTTYIVSRQSLPEFRYGRAILHMYAVSV